MRTRAATLSLRTTLVLLVGAMMLALACSAGPSEAPAESQSPDVPVLSDASGDVPKDMAIMLEEMVDAHTDESSQAFGAPKEVEIPGSAESQAPVCGEVELGITELLQALSDQSNDLTDDSPGSHSENSLPELCPGSDADIEGQSG